jgi:hypothetical protein
MLFTFRVWFARLTVRFSRQGSPIGSDVTTRFRDQISWGKPLEFYSISCHSKIIQLLLLAGNSLLLANFRGFGVFRVLNNVCHDNRALKRYITSANANPCPLNHYTCFSNFQLNRTRDPRKKKKLSKVKQDTASDG